MIIKVFKIGDVVTHKNGQQMVVVGVSTIYNQTTYTCRWFDIHDQLHCVAFPESDFR